MAACAADANNNRITVMLAPTRPKGPGSPHNRRPGPPEVWRAGLPRQTRGRSRQKFGGGGGKDLGADTRASEGRVDHPLYIEDIADRILVDIPRARDNP